MFLLELFPKKLFFVSHCRFCFFKQSKNLIGVQLRTPKVCLASALVEETNVLLFLMSSARIIMTMELCNGILIFSEQISESWKRVASRNLTRCLNLKNHEQGSPVSHTYETHFQIIVITYIGFLKNVSN